MKNHSGEKQSYLDEYNLKIAPRLKEIDIFIKESEMPVTIWQASQLLDMSYEDVKALVSILEIGSINHKNFFTLLLSGTSKICEIVRRETETGFPEYYTPKEISYIYGLEMARLEAAFLELGVKKVKSECLPYVFELLPADF